jgi:prepilin-type N-terminal cleavage/methylation domain-containing protein
VSQTTFRTRTRRAGFTLIELAVSLFIIALLLGAILVPLATRVEERQIAETQKKQDEIKEALIGFAVANGYLPCPAVSATNGQEGNRTAGECAPRAGYLPWRALGVDKVDSWGQIYRYSVTPAFTNNTTTPTPVFSLATNGDITVNTRDNAGIVASLASANTVVAIVISHGKNGYGGVDENNAAHFLPAAWPASFPDENTNATETTTYVSRTKQQEGSAGAGGEFDDVVTWLPRFLLVNRMVAAGKLP